MITAERLTARAYAVYSSPPLWLRIVTCGLARSWERVAIRDAGGWHWDDTRRSCAFAVCCAIGKAQLEHLRAEQIRAGERRVGR